MELQPAVLRANRAVIPVDTTVQFSRVQSRMLLWSEKDGGAVAVNGHRHALNQSRYLLLPWNHSIRYIPDAHPLYIAGIHIIPRLEEESPEFEIYHALPGQKSPFHGRFDSPSWPGGQNFLSGPMEQGTSLRHFCEYIVEVHRRGKLNLPQARRLGEQLLEELIESSKQELDGPNPQRLIHLQGYIRNRLKGKIILEDLARQGNCSIPTVIRMFKTHTGLTPIQWINRCRIDKAQMLMLEAGLGVGQAGEQVGIPDPYHFSRLFKQITGRTARQWLLTRRMP